MPLSVARQGLRQAFLCQRQWIAQNKGRPSLSLKWRISQTQRCLHNSETLTLANAPATILGTNQISSPTEEDSFTDLIMGNVKEDTKNIYNEIISMLSKYVKNDEMFNISRDYFELLDSKLGITNIFLIYAAKALNYHTRQDANLNEDQIKILAIAEILFSCIVLRDDVLDDALLRRNSPPAYLRWGVKKTAFTVNMMVGFCLTEEANIKSSDMADLMLYNSSLNKCLLMPLMHGYFGEDVDINVPLMDYYKFGKPYGHIFGCLARSGHASFGTEEIMRSLGYNMGMLFVMIDDVKDLQTDIADGLVTPPILFAMEEHPIIKEMIQRRYKEPGDKEKLQELVRNSQGIDKSKRLAMKYQRNALRFARLLADSEYRAAVEKMPKVWVSFIETPSDSAHALDMFGTKGF